MRHGRLFFRPNYSEISRMFTFRAQSGKNSTEMACLKCHVWAHVELFLHTLRFLQPIFTYHIDPMCVPFSLRVHSVQWWNNSRRKTP